MSNRNSLCPCGFRRRETGSKFCFRCDGKDETELTSTERADLVTAQTTEGCTCNMGFDCFCDDPEAYWNGRAQASTLLDELVSLGREVVNEKLMAGTRRAARHQYSVVEAQLRDLLLK